MPSLISEIKIKDYVKILITTIIIVGSNNIYAQNKYKSLIIDNDSLKITYLIKEPIKVNNNPSKYWTIKGKLIVENKRPTLTRYGNGISNLIINDSLRARPYIETYATIMVDVAIIDLVPNSKNEYKVYWKFNSKIFSIDKINIALRKSLLGFGDL